MTRHEIAVLACKILALWVVVQIVMDLASLLSLAWYLIDNVVVPSRRVGLTIYTYAPILILTVAQSVIAWVLWFRAPRLASRMVSTDPQPVTNATVTKDDVMAVAISVIGIYLLVQGIDSVVQILLEYKLGSEHGGLAWYLSGWQSQFWASVIHVVIAIWLILGSRGIVHFMKRVRTAGVRTNTA
ncbi:MAG TPA: hypothetical protein VGG19_17820 [Tepidisphaeraceae bacterium]|jgi:hypothetical protein